MSDVVPDHITPLVGFRAWHVTQNGTLMSLNHETSDPWVPRTRKIAICSSLKETGWGPSQYLHASSYVTTSVSYTTSSSVMPPARALGHAYNVAKNAAPKETFEAIWEGRKRDRLRRNHRPPELSCGCGIYAAKMGRQDYAKQFVTQRESAWGEVYLWGKVQDYSEGYRAEFAYPKSLSTNSPWADLIEQNYGVPCAFVAPTSEELEQWARPRGHSNSTSVALSSGSTNFLNTFGGLSTSVSTNAIGAMPPLPKPQRESGLSSLLRGIFGA